MTSQTYFCQQYLHAQHIMKVSFQPKLFHEQTLLVIIIGLLVIFIVVKGESWFYLNHKYSLDSRLFLNHINMFILQTCFYIMKGLFQPSIFRMQTLMWRRRPTCPFNLCHNNIFVYIIWYHLINWNMMTVGFEPTPVQTKTLIWRRRPTRPSHLLCNEFYIQQHESSIKRFHAYFS